MRVRFLEDKFMCIKNSPVRLKFIPVLSKYYQFCEKSSRKQSGSFGQSINMQMPVAAFIQEAQGEFLSACREKNTN